MAPGEGESPPDVVDDDQFHINPLQRQGLRHPIGPFHGSHTAVKEELLESGRYEFGRAAEPVKIHMKKRAAALVFVD